MWLYRHRRGRTRGPTRIAVTLVELVAMVGLLGLLLLMLEPSLGSLRQRSKNSMCLDRMRAIGAASAIYTASDSSEAAIPVHPMALQTIYNKSNHGAYAWGGKSGVGVPGFIPGPAGMITSMHGTWAGYGPASRPLNRVLYPGGFKDHLYPVKNSIGARNDAELKLTAYQCPADDGPPPAGHCPAWVANAEESSFDHFGNSYAANVYMVSYFGGGWLYSNSPFMRPLADVPNPSRTYFYEENIGRFVWACRRQACDFIQPGLNPGPTKAVPGWHGKNWTYNHVYGDGHAATRAIFIENSQDINGYSLHYRTEIVFPDDPDMQSTMRCVIIRGDGWQKDTLPAPAVNTGFYSSQIGPDCGLDYHAPESRNLSGSGGMKAILCDGISR